VPSYLAKVHHLVACSDNFSNLFNLITFILGGASQTDWHGHSVAQRPSCKFTGELGSLRLVMMITFRYLY
jgi:hypothetical protein